MTFDTHFSGEKFKKATTKFSDVTLELYRSLLFDKEDFISSALEAFLRVHQITPEIFQRDWVIEEQPIEILSEDTFTNYRISYRQNIIFRPKTEAERQLEITLKEINNDDPNNL